MRSRTHVSENGSERSLVVEVPRETSRVRINRPKHTMECHRLRE